jgi:hypothetical protein
MKDNKGDSRIDTIPEPFVSIQDSNKTQKFQVLKTPGVIF